MKAPATRVRVRVSPRAARSEVVGRHGDAWKLRVTAPPEATLALIAGAAAVPRARLSLVAGATSRDKLVEVEGLPADELERRLAASSTGKDNQ